ncbi:Ankyrin repeat-containing protein ITN1 [Vitis vinifera]|uniref:Ankyrin repeat-containing protein ITN1 n=1 Tax=Vitis vinifera TaxID=29760 RepID=A0A438J8N0_VITVI|nr:Ankyrin repeat-containing protein ITN1 [Vitis vinifera]
MDRKFGEQHLMREREKRLYEASVDGSVNSLKQLMKEDPLALARASVTCFDETPLHIAAMLGHLDFAKALASHKPDMAMIMTTAIDLQGRSPLHLASANGHIEIVNMLLSLNSNICLICDEDGRTPLHLAVMKGHVEVTRELIRARPEVTGHKLDHGETILHSSVRHNRLGALKMLVESVREAEFINARDDYGNTVLHTATTLKQLETVRYLLSGNMVEVNAVNESGLTALDVIEHMPRDLKSTEIRESLSKAGALRARNVPANGEREIAMVIEESRLDSVAQPLDVSPRVGLFSRGISNKTDSENKENWLKGNRDALMVTVGVIAAMAYQAGLNPPSDGYPKFMAYNTFSLVASLSIVLLLISGLPMKKRIFMWLLMVAMWVTITFMTLTYLISVRAVSPDHEHPYINRVVGNSLSVWLGVIGFVLLVHTIRFLMWCVREVQFRKKPISIKSCLRDWVSNLLSCK